VFSGSEIQLVAGLSAPLGEALRCQVRAELTAEAGAVLKPPGLSLFDERGQLASANEHARTWLEELPSQDRVPTGLGLHVPVWVLVTAVRAHDSLIGGGDGTARTRVRSRQGRWLLGHASCTSDAHGRPAGTAMVLEPASPAQIAPIIVDAYGLTEREREVVRQLARGAGTAEMARTLHLSPHTVRDHVKAILTKVGVSTRGELVAALFADHYGPAHLAAGAREVAGAGDHLQRAQRPVE
jgi:DNA-binding CsgD family transcriptional regulator